MKLCKIQELTGGEILAKDILTSELKVLLSAGIVLRPEYIAKINSLGITEVYIEEKLEEKNEVLLLKTSLENEFHDKVKHIMERHLYSKNKELMKLSETADHIIMSVLEENRIVEKIYDIKERSSDIYEHSVNVCSLATLTALRMKIDKSTVHDIAAGCLLHDIGLRYLPINYVNRNVHEMTETEAAEYRKHPVYGYVALKDEDWISGLVKQIVLYHHERKDRNGFPIRPAEVRKEIGIVSVCDVFDEMICGIGYRREKVYQAVEYLKAYRGVSFDSDIVDIFLEFVAVYPVGSKVLLNNGKKGTVLKQSKGFPDRPVIRLEASQGNNGSAEDRIIDLTQKTSIFVEKVLE
jgi:hypothetical protein